MSTLSTDYETRKHPTNKSKYILMNHSTETAEEVRLQGWWLYVRLTERAESLDGIYLPQKSRDEHTCTYEVIAVGEMVGEYRHRQPKFKGVQEMDRNAVLDVEVGDTILIPEKCTSDSSGYARFVKRSCISDFEGLIDAGLILAKVA